MKRAIRILMLFLAISAFAATKNYAQEVVVHARMVGHEPARPPRPSPRHMWVGGEWVVNGGTYVYKPGYWAEPPQPGIPWVRGHWDRRHGGYVWVPGHWRV